MPSKTILSVNYVYKNGKISVHDNMGIVQIMISPDIFEEIKRGGMSFWRDTSSDRTAVVYISDSNIAYIAVFESDIDVEQAVNTIISLL